MGENDISRPVEELSREIDAAMAKGDFGAAAQLSRTILMRPVNEIGMEVFVRASVVFAYALFMLKKSEEAKNVLLSLVKSNMGLTDSYFLLFCLAYEQKNLEEIKDYGNKFLDMIPDPENPPECVTTAVESAPDVINNMATVLLDEQHYEEALDILEKGLKLNDTFHLFYVNKGIALHTMDKFQEAEETLQEGMQKCDKKGDIYRTLGLIYDERNYYLRAEMSLRKALELDVVEAHMDLALMYNRLSKIYDAEEEVQEYLKHVPGESTATNLLYKIRSLDFYGKPEMKISAALIVKNEEHMLAECIESFREAVDEIVIVDTGSTDKTVEIAKEYNVELFHHEWKDDFSEARNFSISKTTGDMVLIIDADERIEREDIVKIRALKWQTDYDVLCFCVYSSLPGHLGDASFGKHYSPRLFKKSDNIYYYGIVHNILHIPDKAGFTDIRMYHLGYNLDQEKMKKKFERSIKLLKKQVEEHPDDPFVLMNTAQMYLSRNFSDEAMEYAKRCVDVLKDDPGEQEHLLLMALYQLSLIYLRKLDFAKCEEYALQALERKDDYIDPMLNLGWCYYAQKDYDKAIPILNKFLDHRGEQAKLEDFNLLILNKLGSDYEAYFMLGEIQRLQGNFEQAREFFQQALDSNPLYWSLYDSLGKIYMQEGKYSDAADAFENAIKYGYLNMEKYGTVGAPNEVYKAAIGSYKEAIEKDVAAKKSRPSVENALANIDALLDDGIT
ncbi:tetratricopeptide repeat protein [candidate division KSB1 bacterium]